MLGVGNRHSLLVFDILICEISSATAAVEMMMVTVARQPLLLDAVAAFSFARGGKVRAGIRWSVG
jgi:hypothetical protein